MYSDDKGKTITYASLDGKIVKRRSLGRDAENFEPSTDFFFLSPLTIVWAEGYAPTDDKDKNDRPYQRSFLRYAKNGKIYNGGMPYTKAEGDGATESGTTKSGWGR